MIRLALKRGPSKLQQDMAKNVEELAVKFELMMKQFSGFQNMMKDSLDSLNAMGSWQISADKVFSELCEKAKGTTPTLEAV